MATWAEAQETLIEQIKTTAEGETRASHLLQLAEALAWLNSPNQPHGGSTST